MNKIEVKIIKYSESAVTKKRIATFVIRAPKFIQAHINSHRALSRNSASSRAIPAKRIRTNVLHSPFVPVYFGENKSGMQSGDALKGFKLWCANKIWLWARYVPVLFHWFGEKVGIHKEVVNRLIEPWLVVNIVLTGTEWSNFITLRSNKAAQPEMQVIASKIDELLKNTAPQILQLGQWHLPFIQNNEVGLDLDQQKKISAARCARVSYKLFDGKDSNIDADINICEKLISSGHWSPFEHQAEALDNTNRSANFVGWKQYRKEFEGESGGDYKV